MLFGRSLHTLSCKYCDTAPVIAHEQIISSGTFLSFHQWEPRMSLIEFFIPYPIFPLISTYLS